MCNITRTSVDKKKSLQQAEDAAVKGGNVDFFRQLKTEVNDLLRLEEKLWQQRSHTHRMVSGDRNTSYFIIGLHKDVEEITFQSFGLWMEG